VSQENVEIVRQIFEAINSEDIDLILSLTHSDFALEAPPEVSAEGDTYRGADGMRRYWESFQDAMDEIRFQAERLWDSDQGVVVELRVTAKGRHTAIPVEQRSVGVWGICDRTLISVDVYPSLAAAFKAVGLME
jgi:ketosteroid isomerase-like protein